MKITTTLLALLLLVTFQFFTLNASAAPATDDDLKPYHYMAYTPDKVVSADSKWYVVRYLGDSKNPSSFEGIAKDEEHDVTIWEAFPAGLYSPTSKLVHFQKKVALNLVHTLNAFTH